MSLADSLYNLQLIREFCESCLKSCCPLLLEDMLYSPLELQVHHYLPLFTVGSCICMCYFVCNSGLFVVQVNMLCFLAELLYWFEVSKPEFVQPLNTTELTG